MSANLLETLDECVGKTVNRVTEPDGGYVLFEFTDETKILLWAIPEHWAWPGSLTIKNERDIADWEWEQLGLKK